ncbi:MAG: PAS domain-containing protein [Proteobacteria bacterium]|nr:PAS domain-containing protein [Pseudomonadota bacterium]
MISGVAPSRERLRSFRVLGAARLMMSGILLGWFLLTEMAPAHASHRLGLWIALGYAVVVTLQFVLSHSTSRGFAWQILAAVLTDLAGYATLQFLAGQPSREFILSYTLPVLAAGVYGTLRFTLATAAAVSLILLAQALWMLAGNGRFADPQFLGAGFVGAAYFAIGVLAWQLSQRLVRQEERARASEMRAKRQLAINRHVLLEQPDGVMVLDATLRVETANPAAVRMLGLSDPNTAEAEPVLLTGHPGARVLADAVRQHAALGFPPAPVTFEGPSGLRLQARVQLLRQLPGEPGYVVFVQDLREISHQIQQDKLAALGRLVAGVAHEIRNPLSAIAQANQLSTEPGLNDVQRERMSALIAQNVDRLNRIVEDVLDLGRSTAREGIDLQPMRMLRELVTEFDHDGQGRVALLADDEAAILHFDPQHLRRVLVNLLGNARRFASTRAGAIRVRLRGIGRVRELSVANDGPVVAPEKRAQMFEPFFTTDSRGTGLGLYISQELCSRYGARLEYRVRRAHDPKAFGEFVIITTAAIESRP